MRVKRMGHTLGSRAVAVMLTICMLLTMTPVVTAVAQVRTLTGFAALTDQVRLQTVPTGTAQDALNLPDELSATALLPVREENTLPADAPDEGGGLTQIPGVAPPLGALPETEEIAVPGVRWQSAPLYDGAVAGSYVFTALLPEGYVLGAGVSLPQITVTVEQAQTTPRTTLLTTVDAPGGELTALTQDALDAVFGAGNTALDGATITLQNDFKLLAGINAGALSFTLDLNGKVITFAPPRDPGLKVAITTKSTGEASSLTIRDSSEEKTGKIDGGWDYNLYVSNTNLTIEGGTLTRESSYDSTVMVELPSESMSASVRITGGKIENSSGWAIRFASRGTTTLDITGGEISVSGNRCAAIDCQGTAISIGGNAVISSPGRSGIALECDAGSSLSITENPSITGIISCQSAPLNAQGYTGGKLSFLLKGEAATAGTVAVQNYTDASNVVFYTPDFKLAASGNDLVMEAVPVHTHGEGAEKIEFHEWKDPTNLPTQAGSYYLCTDVNLVKSIAGDSNVLLPDVDVPSGNTNLCLCGHSVDLGEVSISLSDDAHFGVYDCTNTGRIFNNTDSSFASGGTIPPLVYVTSTNNVLDLYGGTLEALSSGAVRVNDNAVVNINGGKVISRREYGIESNEAATVRISGGEVLGVYGGVDSRGNATFYMTGGLVKGDDTGVNLYAGSSATGSFRLSGGTVQGKTRGIYADAPLYLSGSPVVTSEGGAAISAKKNRIVANDGEATPTYYSGGEVTIVPSMEDPEGVCMVKGLQSADAAAKFCTEKQYFRSYAQEAGQDGALTVGQYSITQQPTVDNSYTVAVCAPQDETPMYQWYKAAMTTAEFGADDVAASMEGTPLASYNAALNGGKGGWENALYMGNGGYVCFSAFLPAGGSFAVRFNGLREGEQIVMAMLGDLFGNSVEPIELAKGEDGLWRGDVKVGATYMLVLMIQDAEGSSVDDANLQIVDVSGPKFAADTPITGQTTPVYTDVSSGDAVCKVTFATGYTAFSDPVTFAASVTANEVTASYETFAAAWAAAVAAKTATVKLLADSCTTEMATVPDTASITLDLNGHTIDRGLTAATENGSALSVDTGGTLTLTDSGETGKITGGYSDLYGGGVFVNGGSFIMEGGTITGNCAAAGGGVAVTAGSADLRGGSITGNTAIAGETMPFSCGGLYVGALGAVMGGTIPTVKLSGGICVTGNTNADEKSSNAVVEHLPAGFAENSPETNSVLTVSGALTGTVGVNRMTYGMGDAGFTAATPAPGVVAVAGEGYTLTADDLSKFASDSAELSLALKSGNVELIVPLVPVTMAVEDNRLYAGGKPLRITAGSDNTKCKLFLDDAPITLTGVDGTLADGYDLTEVTVYGGSQTAVVENAEITMTGGTVGALHGGGYGPGLAVVTRVVTVGGTAVVGSESGGGIPIGRSRTDEEGNYFADYDGVEQFSVESGFTGQVYVNLPLDFDLITNDYIIASGVEEGMLDNIHIAGPGMIEGMKTRVEHNVLHVAPPIVELIGLHDYTVMFANGNPITIKAVGTEGRVNVYRDNFRSETPVVFGGMGGDTTTGYDLSNVEIYGGCKKEDVTGNTSVTVEGGTVLALYGGSLSSRVTGDTNIVVTGGTVDRVYGGGGNTGYSGAVSSAPAPVTGTCHVSVQGGAVDSVIGGGENSNCPVGGIDVQLTGGQVMGIDDASASGTNTISITGNAVVMLFEAKSSALTVGGAAKIGGEFTITDPDTGEEVTGGTGIVMDTDPLYGVTQFAISSPLTGGVYLLMDGYDASARPTVITGATADDAEHVFLTCGDPTMLGVMAPYLDGTNIKIKSGVTATFDYQGATGASDTASMPVYFGDPYGTLPAPTKTGFGFTGWYDAETDGDLVTSETVLADDATDHTLYAHWGLTDPTVTLSADKTAADHTGGPVITLTATASHADPGATLTYAWYKGGTKLDGKTGATLALTDVADSGSYTVKVQAASGGMESAWVTAAAVTVTIRYADAPAGSFTLPAGFDSSKWATEDIIVTAGGGCTVCLTPDGTYGSTVTLSTESGGVTDTIYIKNGTNQIHQKTLTYKLDKTDPVVGTVEGNPSSDWATSAAISLTPTDTSGSGVAGVSVIHDEKSVTVTGPTGGKYGFTVTENGDYVITVTDAAGNTATKTVTATKVDGTAPTVSLSPAVEAGKWYGKTEFTVTSGDGDKGSSVDSLTVSGGAFTNADIKMAGKFTAQETTANSYTYTVTATDVAGNAATASVTIQVDGNIDTFVTKVATVNNSSSLDDLLVVLNAYNAYSDDQQSHIQNSVAGKTAYDTFTGYLAGKYGGIVTEITSILAASGPARADADRAQSLYDVLDDTNKANIDKTALDALVTASEAAQSVADQMTSGKPATYDALKKLVEDYAALNTLALDLLTPAEKTAYAALKDKYDLAKAFIDIVTTITKPYNSETAGKVAAATSALTAATAGSADGFIPQSIQDAYTAALAAVGNARDVSDKITNLPAHKPGNECAANGSDYVLHKSSVEEAKLAYEKLTQDERDLISDASREALNSQYAALMDYLEYVSKKDDVEVVGLAENIKTDTIASQPGDKITIELSVEEKVPTASETAAHAALVTATNTVKAANPAAKQAASYDVKLLVKINGSVTGTVQPDSANGKKVLVKVKLAKNLDPDTLAIYHIHDGNSTPVAVAHTVITEGADSLAVFETEQFSYFVFFAEDVTTPTPPTTGGSGSASSTAWELAKPEHGAVTVSPDSPKAGDSVTITAKPDKGYVVDAVTVKDSAGKTVTVTPGKDGSYTFTQPRGKAIISVTFKAADAKLPFTDVAVTDWFYDSVAYVYENDLMNGTAATAFSPDLDTSRGMIVTILWRMEGGPAAAKTARFTDVVSGQYYAEAVAWGAETGIITGYDETRYGPNDPITREQLAAILWRYAKYKAHDVSVGENTNILSYLDFQQISEYAIGAIQWVCGAGLMQGRGGGYLDPRGHATRAETAALLQRFLTRSGN